MKFINLVDTHWKPTARVLLIGYKLCFCGETRKILYSILLLHIHVPLSAHSQAFPCLQITAMYFYLLLYKSICCWYSSELPQQVVTLRQFKCIPTTYAFIDLSRQFKWVPITYAFVKRIRRKNNHVSIIKQSYQEVHCWSFSKVSVSLLGGYFTSYFEKPHHTVQ